MTPPKEQISFEITDVLENQRKDSLELQLGGSSYFFRFDVGGGPDPVISRPRAGERSVPPTIPGKWFFVGGIMLSLFLTLIGVGFVIYFYQETDTNMKTECYKPTKDTEVSPMDIFHGFPEPTDESVFEDNKLLEVEQTSQNQASSEHTAAALGLKLFEALYEANETESEVERLIRLGADVNVTNGVGSITPLHYVSLLLDENVFMNVIKLLIENGADVYAMDWTSHTFLHYLVESRHFQPSLSVSQFQDISEYLISKNLSQLFNTPGNFTMGFLETVGITEYRLTTPFQLAVKNLEIPMTTLRLLKNNGVDFNAANSQGDSTLFYALLGKRSVRMITDLVELGADWRHLNRAKENMVHLGVRLGGVDELKYFIGLGLDINAVDGLGDTPLHKAVRYSTRDVLGKARFLILNGADVNINNKHGKTTLDVALMREDLVDKDKLVELLTEQV